MALPTPKQRSNGTALPAAVPTVVYTCPANFTAQIVLLVVSNKGSGNKTVTISWTDSHSGSSYSIVAGYTLSGYNFLKFDQSYLVLNAGDTLTITSEAGSTMDATVTVEEYFDPASRQ
jgi:hypothetical protein